MFSVLVSVCNEVLPLALGTKRLLSLMTLWIGQEGVEKKTQKKQKRGLLRARPQALKPQPCYYCTSAEKRSQTGAAARGAPSLSWRLLQSLWFWKLTEACVLLCRSRRGETEQWLSSSRRASDVDRSTWGQPLTQRSVYSAFRSSWEVPT